MRMIVGKSILLIQWKKHFLIQAYVPLTFGLLTSNWKCAFRSSHLYLPMYMVAGQTILKFRNQNECSVIRHNDVDLWSAAMFVLSYKSPGKISQNCKIANFPLPSKHPKTKARWLNIFLCSCYQQVNKYKCFFCNHEQCAEEHSIGSFPV